MSDVMCSWERDDKLRAASVFAGVEGSRFVLKKKYWFDADVELLTDKAAMLSDPLRLDVMYAQVQQEVHLGYIPVDEAAAATLAATQLAIANISPDVLTKDTLAQYLPRRFAGADPKVWATLLHRATEETRFQLSNGTVALRDAPTAELKLGYLLLASRAPRFGECSFQVLHKDTRVELTLALSRKGVAIYATPFAEVAEKSWSYASIQNWTSSHDTIVLTTGNLMKPVKVQFQLRPHAALDSVVTVAEVFRQYEEQAKRKK